MDIKCLTRQAIIAAVAVAGQVALACIPNVEVVSIIFLCTAYVFGWEAILGSIAFSFIEIFIYGIGIWNIMYLFIVWPFIITITILLKKIMAMNRVSASIICGLFGLTFGALCSIPYLFTGGPVMMYTWWLSGLSFDIVHCIGNVVMGFVMFPVLVPVMERFR